MIRKHGEMTRFCSRYNVMKRKCEQNAGQCSPPKNHTTIDANIYMIDSPCLAEFILLFEYAQVVPFDRVANSKKKKDMKIERGIQLNLNKLQPTDIEKNVNKKKMFGS